MFTVYVKSINVFIFVLAFLFLVSCKNETDNSKENSSSTNKKDKWGRAITREDFIKDAANLYRDMFRELDLKGDDVFKAAEEMAVCVWDSETTYLENHYPEGPRSGVNYSLEIPKDDRKIIFDLCVREILKKYDKTNSQNTPKRESNRNTSSNVKRYSIANTYCNIDFQPRGDMADYYGYVKWDKGTGTTKLEYNQDLSSKMGKCVYKEFSGGKYTGMYIFNEMENISGEFVRADGKSFSITKVN